MLNLLRFRTRTAYEDKSGFSEVSGVEGYTRYREAFHAVTQSLKVPISLVYVGQAYPGLVPGVGKWDAIALVKYPSFTAFRSIIESEDYIKTAQPHRLAALEDWYFMPTTEVSACVKAEVKHIAIRAGTALIMAYRDYHRTLQHLEKLHNQDSNMQANLSSQQSTVYIVTHI